MDMLSPSSSVGTSGFCPSLNTDAKESIETLGQIARLPKTSKAYLREVAQFLLRHVGLAYQYAARWRSAQIPQEDLRQQAVLGLLEAIHLWNPAKATFFSTYAIHRMRYQLSRFVEKKWPLVHLPQNVLSDRRLVKKAVQQLTQTLCREPRPEEICASVPTLSPIRIELALSYETGLHFQSLEEEPSDCLSSH